MRSPSIPARSKRSAPSASSLSAMGRHDEAIEAMEQARRLDPRSVETLQHLAIVYWMAGQGDRALEAVDDSLKVAPGSLRGTLWAHDDPRPARSPRRGDGRASYDAPGAERRPGSLPSTSRRWPRSKGWRRGDGCVDRLARAHQSLGGCGDAMDGRRRVVTGARCPRALREGAHHLPVLHGAKPYFRPLHNNPRFQRILQALKLDGRISAVVPSCPRTCAGLLR